MKLQTGTIFPLVFQPQTDDAPDYIGRKYGFSLTTMIICDHNRKISTSHFAAAYIAFLSDIHRSRGWSDSSSCRSWIGHDNSSVVSSSICLCVVATRGCKTKDSNELSGMFLLRETFPGAVGCMWSRLSKVLVKTLELVPNTISRPRHEILIIGNF
jgi:hypothetical protein